MGIQTDTPTVQAPDTVPQLTVTAGATDTVVVTAAEALVVLEAIRCPT